MAGMYRPKSDTVYMETVYPVLRQVHLVLNFLRPICFHLFPIYLISFKFEPKWLLAVLLMLQSTLFFFCSMFSLLFLHFFLYGCNIFMWRKTRINYTFIFELAPTKDLKYRDVFLICTTSMTAVMGVLFVHLSLVAKGYSYSQVQAIPALLLLVIF